MATTDNTVMARLLTAQRAGLLGELQIEYWNGGGQPPPYYRSEQLRLLSRSSKLVAELAILRFHPKLTPHEVIERYTRPVSADIVRSVATILVADRVFQTEYAEEMNPGIPSLISHELIVRVENDELKKKFFGSMPKQLGELETTLKKIADGLRNSGERSWLHSGKPIENPFAGRQ